MTFFIGTALGFMLAVLVGGAITALADRWPNNNKDIDVAFVRITSERNRLQLENDDLREQVDKLRLENARLREIEIEEE